MKKGLRDSIIYISAPILLGIAFFPHYLLEKISIGVEWIPSKSQTLRYSERLQRSGVLGLIIESDSLLPKAEVEFTCPQIMRQNETKEVEIEHLIADNSGTSLEVTALVAELYSSAFEVAPSKPIKKSQFLNTPSTIIWMITPKSEGKHLLMLDLSYSKENEYRLEDRTLKSAIRVLTVWGVSRILFNIIRIVIGIVVFVITYPLFVAWAKKRTSKSKKKKKYKESKKKKKDN